jgi:hypothetical protein
VIWEIYRRRILRLRAGCLCSIKGLGSEKAFFGFMGQSFMDTISESFVEIISIKEYILPISRFYQSNFWAEINTSNSSLDASNSVAALIRLK